MNIERCLLIMFPSNRAGTQNLVGRRGGSAEVDVINGVCDASRTYRLTEHRLTGCHPTPDLPVRAHASGTVAGPPFLTVSVRGALPRARV